MSIQQILVKGITGFDMPKDTKTHSLLEVQNALKSIHYPYLTNKEIQVPHTSANYFRISILEQQLQQKYDLLIHQHLWYIVCIEPTSKWMNLKFIEMPKRLSNSLSYSKKRLHFLKEIFLNAPIEQKHLSLLGKNEKLQIEYWETKTYGEIIFNGYD